MLDEEMINRVVNRLAKNKFVNGEAFSHAEREQILDVWRKHPLHPSKDAK
jgi:hypothetical protein